MPQSRVVLTGGDLLARQHLAHALHPVLQALGFMAELVCPNTPESLTQVRLPCHYLLWHANQGQHAQWRVGLSALGVPYQVIQGGLHQALKQSVLALLPPDQAQGWARPTVAPSWTGVCEACGDASCEQRLFGRLLASSLKS